MGVTNLEYKSITDARYDHPYFYLHFTLFKFSYPHLYTNTNKIISSFK